MSTTYHAKTIRGAERRVRELLRMRDEYERICVRYQDEIERLKRERRALAKLAADEPQFYNPLDVWEAQRLRDRVLDEQP